MYDLDISSYKKYVTDDPPPLPDNLIFKSDNDKDLFQELYKWQHQIEQEI